MPKGIGYKGKKNPSQAQLGFNQIKATLRKMKPPTAEQKKQLVQAMMFGGVGAFPVKKGLKKVKTLKRLRSAGKSVAEGAVKGVKKRKRR